MASGEGFVGVRLAGKRIMLWGSIAGVILAMAIDLAHGQVALRDLLYGIAIPLVLGGALWTFGWLLRGNNRTRRSGGVNTNIW